MGQEWFISGQRFRHQYFLSLYFSFHAEREVQITPKGQKETRKTDQKSIVNILETGYNEWQEETATPAPIKDFKDLDLTDNFMFTKVMTDPELCKELLEAILGVEIERIVYSEKEHTLDEKADAKGVRLDVYVKDCMGTFYNVEMQATNPGNLPKRSRYYQDLIDLNLIAKGEDYEKLNKSFVIFICLDDIFKGGRHIYTFENRCIQAPGIILGDETTKIFLNPYSEMDDISPKLANFLKFLTDGKTVDDYTERLVEALEAARNNKMWEVEYKAYYVNLQDKYNKGLTEGLTALVASLKSVLKDFDKVYEAVRNNEIYSDATREKVFEYYQKCP